MSPCSDTRSSFDDVSHNVCDSLSSRQDVSPSSGNAVFDSSEFHVDCVSLSLDSDVDPCDSDSDHSSSFVVDVCSSASTHICTDNRGSHDLSSSGLRSSPADVIVADASHPSHNEEFLNLHARVFASGLPNYQSSRIPVPSHLNVSVWRDYLQDYSDTLLCDFLEYGWPVGYNYVSHGFPVSDLRNHKGALTFPDHIDRYLSKESSLSAVIGPFSSNPFNCGVAVSPLNSVPKSDSVDRRIIVDLSWPPGSSVNDGISSTQYLGDDISLTYPTVDSICSLICLCGPGCLIYKRDLRRAYRQFPVDPYDYPLLCYRWRDNLYCDVVLPMGLRSAAMACQRSTNAVSHICRTTAGYNVLNYLDDFIGVESPSIAESAYIFSGSLLHELGLEESPSKACPPATSAVCLGVLFDTIDMTMSVTPERITEIEALLGDWSGKKIATRSELQSLVGKLSFISKCVRQSRLFLSRILALLRALKRPSHRVRLTREFRRDIAWWQRFLRAYNGVSVISLPSWTAPDTIFSTDACLSGCGGLSDTHYFHAEFPSAVLTDFPDIHHLEALAILVALRLWGHLWSGLRIRVYCDNLAVVSALASGKVKDQRLASCLRAIWFVAASHSFELRALHLPGEQNRAADLLSRWHLNDSHGRDFQALPGFSALTEATVSASLFQIDEL